MDVFLRDGCDVVFRGLRNEKDKRYEEAQMGFHDLIHPGFLKSVKYIEAEPRYRHVSSTVIKAFILRHIDVSDMVPPFIKDRLEQHIHKQFFVGITGPMAVGKTTVATAAVEEFRKRGIPAQHLNVDDLVRELYVEDTTGARIFRTASLDRLDNTKGYEVGNFQWVHKDINQIRGSLSIPDFMHWCKLIAEKAEKGNQHAG